MWLTQALTQQLQRLLHILLLDHMINRPCGHRVHSKAVSLPFAPYAKGQGVRQGCQSVEVEGQGVRQGCRSVEVAGQGVRSGGAKGNPRLSHSSCSKSSTQHDQPIQ